MKRRRTDRQRPVCTVTVREWLAHLAHLTIRGES